MEDLQCSEPNSYWQGHDKVQEGGLWREAYMTTASEKKRVGSTERSCLQNCTEVFHSFIKWLAIPLETS